MKFMKGKISFLISLILGCVIFGYALKKVDLASLKSVWQALSLKTIGLVLVTYFVAFILAILRWRIFIKKQGIQVSFKQMVLSRLVGDAFNYLTPIALAGGESFKVLVAAEEHKESYKKITATVVVEELIHFATLGFFIILGTAYNLIRYIHEPQIGVFAILFVILIFTTTFLVALWFGFSRADLEQKALNPWLAKLQSLSFFKKLESIVHGLKKEINLIFSNGRRAIINASLLAVGDILVNAFMWWILLSGMGYKLNFPQYVVVWSLLYLAFLVPVPAALGSLELSQIAAFGILGFRNPQTIAMAFAFTNRGVTVFFVVIGLLIALYYWIKITLDKYLTKAVKTTQNFFKFFATLVKGGLFTDNGDSEDDRDQ